MTTCKVKSLVYSDSTVDSKITSSAIPGETCTSRLQYRRQYISFPENLRKFGILISKHGFLEFSDGTSTLQSYYHFQVIDAIIENNNLDYWNCFYNRERRMSKAAPPNTILTRRCSRDEHADTVTFDLATMKKKFNKIIVQQNFNWNNSESGNFSVELKNNHKKLWNLYKGIFFSIFNSTSRGAAAAIGIVTQKFPIQ